MSKATERILQIAAILFICWFGYSLVERSVITILQTQAQTRQLLQQLQQCEQSNKS